MISHIRKQLFHFSLRHPNFAKVFRRISYYIWRISLKFNKSKSLNPDLLISIDPDNINLYLGGKAGNRFFTRGKVHDGNWDLEVGKFEGWDVQRSIKAHYLENTPWVDTDYYKRALHHLKKEKFLRGENNIDRIFSRIENLYQSIKTNGIKPMKEWSKLDNSHWENLDKLSQHDDITVAIDRKGRFMLQDGKHRLAFAKLLKLKTIPVAVGLRHQKWVDFRDEIQSFCNKRGSAYQPFTHPDLQDFPVHHNDHREKDIENNLPTPPGTLLDLGAYFGFFCCHYSKLGWDCTAVEHHKMHSYFISRLAEAEELNIKVFTMSLFDIPKKSYDVVLALNIFHHYLKTKSLFNQLSDFLSSLTVRKQIYLETHQPQDPIMTNSFKNFEPLEFAKYVAKKTNLSRISFLRETTRNRHLYLIEK